MSDPISPAGSQVQAPMMAMPTLMTVPVRTSAIPGDQDEANPTFSVGAATGAKVTIEAQESVSLELSPSATSASQAPAGPKVMSIEDAAKAFQEYLKNLPSDLQFVPDASTGIVVFKVVNPITHEVLRQYPPEEMLKMVRSLREAMKPDPSGILLDHKL